MLLIPYGCDYLMITISIEKLHCSHALFILYLNVLSRQVTVLISGCHFVSNHVERVQTGCNPSPRHPANTAHQSKDISTRDSVGCANLLPFKKAIHNSHACKLN